MTQSTSPQTTIETKKLDQLYKEIAILHKKIKEHEQALDLCSKSISKASEALNDIATIQATHLEHTSKVSAEIQAVSDLLFPQDNLKYDLSKEPYN
jgi:septal ring factor EnvC (AmiA/AmiB activator)